MRNMLLSMALALCAGHASAGTCPDKYRFVDFGLEGSDGILRRGGTIFRAFLPDNTPLLRAQSTVCEDVADLGKDGRSLEIPVVSHIRVDTRLIKLELQELSLTKADDVTALAQRALSPHQSTLHRAEITRGETFLCAATKDQDSSCQLVSPFDNNIPLTVYCDAEHCEMPVLGFNNQLMFRAIWGHDTADDATLGPDISQKLTDLRDFLSQHMDF